MKANNEELSFIFSILIDKFFSFLLISFSPSYAQIIKDTVLIRFNEKVDLIKKTERGRSNIWLFNILYEKELKQYEKKMRKYRKDTLLPPQIFYPVKPIQYYKYFLVDEAQLCNKFIERICKGIDFYDRKKLKTLNPTKKLILVVRQKEDSIICFPVSFYRNVRE